VHNRPCHCFPKTWPHATRLICKSQLPFRLNTPRSTPGLLLKVEPCYPPQSNLAGCQTTPVFPSNPGGKALLCCLWLWCWWRQIAILMQHPLSFPIAKVFKAWRAHIWKAWGELTIKSDSGTFQHCWKWPASLKIPNKVAFGGSRKVIGGIFLTCWVLVNIAPFIEWEFRAHCMALRKPACREINHAWLTCVSGSFLNKIAVVVLPIVTCFIHCVFLHWIFQQGPNADCHVANVWLF
jgi:hypothetical protein